MTKHINSSALDLLEDVNRDLEFSGSESPTNPADGTAQRHARFFGEDKMEHAENTLKHSFISDWGIDDEKDK